MSSDASNVDPNVLSGTTNGQADGHLVSLDQLLGQLDDLQAGRRSHRSADQERLENKLIQVRLGAATCLFSALRVKHSPTADHSLRVALGCSAWAEWLGLPVAARDELEVAALLHDVGKIGVDDTILRKPSALTQDQTVAAQKSREYGLQILAGMVSDNVLAIVSHVGAWYDGSRKEYPCSKEDIPVASRMIQIVDVYDNITTDTVYRRAVSRERAVAELFACSGTQFDPQLVQLFAEAQDNDGLSFHPTPRHAWLAALTADKSDLLWRMRLPLIDTTDAHGSRRFVDELLDGMTDAVLFLDEHGTILRWNRGAEQLTGLTALAMEQRSWLPSLVYLRDQTGRRFPDDECPILDALRRTARLRARFLIRCRSLQYQPIETTVFPVSSESGHCLGVVALFRDTSNQSDLEARVKSLQERATTDQLTSAANRAEFDRIHPDCVSRFLTLNAPYSLIICDIDRFKMINDKYGHPAGDEALVSFARILRECCRSGDVVARYGGEEFVILCEHCTAKEATQLAEKMRLELSRTPLSELSGQCITASFGVTELQPGDSADSMLRRADRGLLRAKDTGRNRVVQLGSGMQLGAESAVDSHWWSRWLPARRTSHDTECCLHTNVPMQVAIEKMRGFIVDHDAEVVRIDGHLVSLVIRSGRLPLRRQSDRPVPFAVDLEFLPGPAASGDAKVATRIHVKIRAIRDRDRRRDPIEAARQVISGLRSYLMAQEISEA